jgi:hypothetical protein
MEGVDETSRQRRRGRARGAAREDVAPTPASAIAALTGTRSASYPINNTLKVCDGTHAAIDFDGELAN